MNQELYSVKQVMEMTSLGRTLIYQMISEGHLPAKKCGNRTLIAREDLMTWIGGLPSVHNQRQGKVNDC